MLYITFAGFYQAAYNLAPESLSDPFSYHLPSDYSGHMLPCFFLKCPSWFCLKTCDSLCSLSRSLPDSLQMPPPQRGLAQLPTLYKALQTGSSLVLFVYMIDSFYWLCVCVCVRERERVTQSCPTLRPHGL